ncbi:hypothetical protein ACFQBQ_03415 [Granulicella cerasi]|uniref:Uncharacterized protein n=1 Tax=Granulicella cerasi TaxID=741063 RepID=A0ABW1Z5H5_9BACT|nr:hypothetical protein [Granulicella cerasi]
MGREIEDTLLQGAQGLILKLESETLQLDPADPRRESFDQALHRANTSLGQVRDMIEVRQSPPARIECLPFLLQDFWNSFSTESCVLFTVAIIGEPQATFDSDASEIAFFGMEAIRRASRRVGVTRIAVEILFERNHLILSIHDDAESCRSRSDLREKEEDFFQIEVMDALELNGAVRIDDQPGDGTIVSLTIKRSSGLDVSCIPRSWRNFLRGISRCFTKL